MSGLTIETKLRPCYIIGGTRTKPTMAKALFHCWSFTSDIYAPSVMVGGHGGGVVARTGAIVELEDGSVTIVEPHCVKFVPGVFDEYRWEEKDVN